MIDTRLASYLATPTEKRTELILNALGTAEMTAREIAYALGFSDLNAVKPRLTELKKSGRIEAIGIADDRLTNRVVRVYRAVDEIIEKGGLNDEF